MLLDFKTSQEEKIDLPFACFLLWCLFPNILCHQHHDPQCSEGALSPVFALLTNPHYPKVTTEQPISGYILKIIGSRILKRYSDIHSYYDIIQSRHKVGGS